MSIKKIPFSAWLRAEEVKIRGWYISLAVDFDFVLIMLIDECFKANKREIKTFYKHKNGKGKDLSELTMFERIEVCKKGLSKYHAVSYKAHKNNFVSIDTLRLIRNKFAHQKIDDVFSANDKTKMTFHELQKNFKVKSLVYNIDDLYKELDEFQKLMQDTLKLMAKIMGIPEPIF